jgi:flagellar hook-associated protein 3 FlgL
MNRISTAQAYDSALYQLQQRQTSLSETQAQLTSGKRVNRASDDPTAAARAERALATISHIDADKRGTQASQSLMAQAESSLGDAGDLLQRARELLVSVGNGGYGPAQRASIASELQGIRDQLLGVANRNDGEGNYLFGGQGSAQAPFVDQPVNPAAVPAPPSIEATLQHAVQYRGTLGQASAAGSEPMPMSLDGAAVWTSTPTGNGTFETRADPVNTGSAWIDAGRVVDPSAVVAGASYDINFSVAGGQTNYTVTKTVGGVPTVGAAQPYQAGTAIQVDGISVAIDGKPANLDHFSMVPSTSNLTVFDTLDKAIADLKNGNKTGAQLTQDNVMNLRNIDQVMTRLQTVRSAVGTTLNRIDSVNNQLDGLKLQSQTDKSNAEDLDMTAAISDFQNKQTGYDAALKSYSMVQRLSLFQYINS